MKNRSIRFKVSVWLSIILIVAVTLTFLATRFMAGMVLRSTIRGYLIGMVEENTDKIAYVETEMAESQYDVYIPYETGYLEIDRDFLDVVNEVYAALYTSDGTLIYGQNPLEKHTADMEFTSSYVWEMEVEGQNYDLYDRQLSIKIPNSETLWIRGIVPETKSEQQLEQISKMSLFLLPILLALFILGGYILVDKFLSPLSKIERAAEQISEGYDLKKRIEVGNSRDEVSHLAEMFNSMLDRLEKAFDTERRFTSDASHELRTPTSVIMTQAEYTLEKERTVEEYIDALEVINKQSHRMNSLLGDMLDYTRMDQKSDRYEMEKLDISRLVTETADQMALLGEKNIQLSIDVAPWLKVIGNEVLLTRMVQNLISNAYRYGVQDGSILVKLNRRDEDVELSIIDDGVGISKDDQEKIFDRFYQADTSRNIQGTGLGLSMVKKIVELHHGRIEVESEKDKGSLFRVLIPMCE